MKKLFCVILIFMFSFVFLCACGGKSNVNSLHINFNFVVEDTLEDGGGKQVKVVLLAGQSNATGAAYGSILKQKISEAEYNKYVSGWENVYINYNTENGQNKSNGFTHTNIESYYTFGPEIGLGEKLGQESDEYFIIKYSYNGSDLFRHWDKDNKCLFKGLVEFTKKSINYLKDKNYKPEIVAMCWMQGESDAYYNKAEQYYENTKNFVSNIRQEFGNIKWIDAAISSSWNDFQIINNSKFKFSQLSDKNYYIDTIAAGLTCNLEPKGNPDIAHYDSLSQIKLGHLFADAILS